MQPILMDKKRDIFWKNGADKTASFLYFNTAQKMIYFHLIL